MLSFPYLVTCALWINNRSIISVFPQTVLLPKTFLNPVSVQYLKKNPCRLMYCCQNNLICDILTLDLIIRTVLLVYLSVLCILKCLQKRDTRAFVIKYSSRIHASKTYVSYSWMVINVLYIVSPGQTKLQRKKCDLKLINQLEINKLFILRIMHDRQSCHYYLWSIAGLHVNILNMSMHAP